MIVKNKKIATFSVLVAFSSAHAQGIPSAGDILRDSRGAIQSPAIPRPTAPSKPAEPVNNPRDSEAALLVRQFEIEGNSVFDGPTLQAQIADLLGRQLTMPEMQSAADRLTLFYRSKGYHAVALLPAQSLQGGVLRILVVEARLGRIRVEPAAASDRVPLALAQAMLERGQVTGELLQLSRLDQSNLILSDVPGVKAETALKQGDGPGQTDVFSVVSALPVWTGNATLDFNDARTTGRSKASLGLAASNALGLGEQTTLALQKTEGKQFALLGYSHPLHPSGTRLSFSSGTLRYHLLNGSQVTGDAKTWAMQLNQPWIRSEPVNLNWLASYNFSDANTRDSAGDSRSQVSSFVMGVSGNWQDEWAGGGFSSWGGQWIAGHEDKSGTSVLNRAFQKWTFNAWRMQRLGVMSQLSLSLNGQWTHDALPAGETLSLGGVNGVRAYPSFEGNGDKGWVGAIEYRHDLSQGALLKVFYDHGRIYRPSASNGPVQYELKGAGAGGDLNVSKALQLRAVLAWRIGRNPYPAPNSGLDADGSLRRPQFWLNAVYTF
jgi:hemolysin activation/secretion protein